MTKPTKPRWGDGDPSYSTQPSTGKQDTGWLAGEKPPFQYANWLQLQNYEWVNWLESRVERDEVTQLRSDLAADWDGSALTLNDDLEIIFRAEESGALRINKIAAGSLTIGNGQVLVFKKDRTDTSPVTLALQAVYASLGDGEYSIVDESSLTLTGAQDEVILFRHRDVSPAYHYGVDQKILEIPFYGHKIYHESKFNLGSDRNLLREENALFSQAIINANMTVSQRGNFTTAITSASGLAHGAFYLDRWKYWATGASLAVSSLQRTAVTIPGHSEIKTAIKSIANTSGSAISGSNFIYQYIEDVEVFRGKTITASFLLRSNVSSNVRMHVFQTTAHQTFEIDTGSGDETWRHYTVTFVLENTTNIFGICIGISDVPGVFLTSIPAGGYTEDTGIRLSIGSDELPAVITSYEQELDKCRRYCRGAPDGEYLFGAGYSIYNISGVAQATWRVGAAEAPWAFCSIVDAGSTGVSHIRYDKIMQRNNVVTDKNYMFDNNSPTAGGEGTAARSTVYNASGTPTNNVTTSLSPSNQSINVQQSTVLVGGYLNGYLWQESEIF